MKEVGFLKDISLKYQNTGKRFISIKKTAGLCIIILVVVLIIKFQNSHKGSTLSFMSISHGSQWVASPVIKTKYGDFIVQFGWSDINNIKTPTPMLIIKCLDNPDKIGLRFINYASGFAIDQGNNNLIIIQPGSVIVDDSNTGQVTITTFKWSLDILEGKEESSLEEFVQNALDSYYGIITTQPNPSPTTSSNHG